MTITADASFVITRSIHAPREARLTFAPLLAAYDAEAGERVLTVVSELVTNVVRHTRTGAGRARLWVERGVARLEVSDGDRHGVTVGTTPPPPHLLGGRGLLIADRLANALTVRPDPEGKTVVALFDLEAVGSPTNGDGARGPAGHRRHPDG